MSFAIQPTPHTQISRLELESSAGHQISLVKLKSFYIYLFIYYSATVGKNGLVDGADPRLIQTIAKRRSFKIQYRVAKGGFGHSIKMVGISVVQEDNYDIKCNIYRPTTGR